MIVTQANEHEAQPVHSYGCYCFRLDHETTAEQEFACGQGRQRNLERFWNFLVPCPLLISSVLEIGRPLPTNKDGFSVSCRGCGRAWIILHCSNVNRLIILEAKTVSGGSSVSVPLSPTYIWISGMGLTTHCECFSVLETPRKCDHGPEKVISYSI